MTRLSWEDVGEFKAGLSRGVFYPTAGPGVAWNGLISVEEDNSDLTSTIFYVDGRKVHNVGKLGWFSGTISAYHTPEKFMQDVVLNRRKPTFGMSYRVETDSSAQIHLVYNVMLTPGEQTRQYTDATQLSWDFTTKPFTVPYAASSAHLIIDVGEVYSSVLSEIEDIIYGSDALSPSLPSPEEVCAIFEKAALLAVTDHGDGTFTVIGPDSAIQMLDATTFEITWPSAVMVDDTSYRISTF